MAGGALAPVGLGEVARDEERPVAGLQREQLADRALVGAGARGDGAQLGVARAPRHVARPAARSTCVRSRGVPHDVTGRPAGGRRRLVALERVVEARERRPCARRLVDDRREPQRALVPPVADELGVERADGEAAARDALARARDEVRRVRGARRRRRARGRTARRRCPTRDGGAA